jgi:hypothetical protein
MINTYVNSNNITMTSEQLVEEMVKQVKLYQMTNGLKQRYFTDGYNTVLIKEMDIYEYFRTLFKHYPKLAPGFKSVIYETQNLKLINHYKKVMLLL